MDGDRLRLPANRNCYKLSRVSWALLKLLVIFCAFDAVFCLSLFVYLRRLVSFWPYGMKDSENTKPAAAAALLTNYRRCLAVASRWTDNVCLFVRSKDDASSILSTTIRRCHRHFLCLIHCSGCTGVARIHIWRQACREYKFPIHIHIHNQQIFCGYPWIYPYLQTPIMRKCSPQIFIKYSSVRAFTLP